MSTRVLKFHKNRGALLGLGFSTLAILTFWGI